MLKNERGDKFLAEKKDLEDFGVHTFVSETFYIKKSLKLNDIFEFYKKLPVVCTQAFI